MPALPFVDQDTRDNPSRASTATPVTSATKHVRVGVGAAWDEN